jgi:hypothetical protein
MRLYNHTLEKGKAMKSYYSTLRGVRSTLESLVDELHSPQQVLDDLLDILKEDCGEYVPVPFKDVE